jgi:hypothetical protein
MCSVLVGEPWESCFEQRIFAPGIQGKTLESLLACPAVSPVDRNFFGRHQSSKSVSAIARAWHRPGSIQVRTSSRNLDSHRTLNSLCLRTSCTVCDLMSNPTPVLEVQSSMSLPALVNSSYQHCAIGLGQDQSAGSNPDSASYLPLPLQYKIKYMVIAL